MILKYSDSIGFIRLRLTKVYGLIQVGKSKHSTYFSKSGNPLKIRVSDHENYQKDVVYSIILYKYNESEQLIKNIDKAIKLFERGNIK